MSSDDNGVTLNAGDLALSDLEGKAGGIGWRVGRLQATAARLANQSGQFASATLSDVRLTMSGLELSIERLSCPDGLAVSTKELLAPRVETSGFTVSSPDMLAIGKKPASDSEVDEAPEATGEAKKPGKRPDLRFLDALFGHLHLDLFLHLSVPVIGERRGTHQFRVGITDGAISFQKVESDLAWLEDAFVDIEVSKDRLVIMHKIPLVPIPGTRLISWQLDPDELLLARERGLVKLSKLVNFELPQKRPEEVKPGKKPKVAFHQIALSNIDVGADAAGPVTCALGQNATFEIGEGESGGIKGLIIAGEIVHRFGTKSPATEMRCGWSAIRAVHGAFKLGKNELTIAAADIGESGGRLGFTGFRPGSLAFAIDTLDIEGLALDLAGD